MSIMSNKKNANVKANETKTSEKSQLQAINLASVKSQLDKIDLKEKKVKETIYKYPESFSKDDINGEKGKKHRNGLRNKLKSFCNNILYYAKTDNLEELQKKINEFKTFYKANYRVNDYSLSSITNSEKREKDIELMIQIIKLSETK